MEPRIACSQMSTAGSTVTAASGYAGDVSSRDAWRMLETDPGAVLVDVRTRPEWSFVGVPDLAPLGRRPVLLSWQSYPHMQVAADFPDQLDAAGVARDATVLFLCRSGARSRSAAIAATAAGFARCINVADGFEGPHDPARHRGTVAGWKASGLPWIQE